MFKPVFGARQAGGPLVRAGLLMTLINVSCWELQEQGRAKGLFFSHFSVFPSSSCSRNYWSNSALDPILQLDFPCHPQTDPCRNVPKTVCSAGWECPCCCFLSVSLVRDICGG